MKLYDTHCHLNAPELLPDLTHFLQLAHDQSVVKMNVVAWDEISSEKAIELAHQYDSLYAVIGIHPVDDRLSQIEERLTIIETLGNNPKVVAIGEIGLDYYWKKDESDHLLQKKALIQQINLANKLKLPIVVHCREAYEDILELFRLHTPMYGGVMHCYGGPQSMVSDFIALGFYISLGGPITFKKSEESRLIAKSITLDRLLIETDAPYLAPVPYRGKTNHPAWVKFVFDEIVKQRPEDPLIIADQIYRNSEKIFHVKHL